MAGRPPVDRIAGLPPRLVYAAILLLDLLILGAILIAFLWSGDRIEDVLFPGGREWLPF